MYSYPCMSVETSQRGTSVVRKPIESPRKPYKRVAVSFHVHEYTVDTGWERNGVMLLFKRGSDNITASKHRLATWIAIFFEVSHLVSVDSLCSQESCDHFLCYFRCSDTYLVRGRSIHPPSA